MSRLTQPWPVRAGRASWLLSAALAVALLVILALFDAELSRFGQGLPPPVVRVFSWITRLGESDYILIGSLVLFALTGGAALAARRAPVKDALFQVASIWGFVFCGVGLPSLVAAIVKRLVGRPRPELLESVGAMDFRILSWLDWTHQSFPSGHATTGFALCFVAGFLWPRLFPWVLTLAVLISVSRIIVGAHYATDIVAGAIVGMLGAYAVRNLFAWCGWVFERGGDGHVVRKPLVRLREVFGGGVRR